MLFETCLKFLRISLALTPTGEKKMQSYDAWKTQATLADQSEKVQKYDHAETAWLLALRVAHSDPEAKELVAYTLQRLARCVWAREKYEEAEQYYLDILNLSENPEVLASAAHDLAKLYHSLNKREASLHYYQYALQAKTSIFGSSHDEVKVLNQELLNVMNSYCKPVSQPRQINSSVNRIVEEWKVYLESAELNLRDGNLSEAERQWKQALEIAELCGLKSEMYCRTLEKVASFLLNQGKQKEAENLLLEAYGIKVAVLSPNHEEIGRLAQDLSIMYFNMECLDRAEPWAKRAYHVFESQNRDSKELACTIHNLAVLYHSKGDYAKSEPFYLKGLELKKRVFGPGHLETINLMRGYADLLNKTGRLDEAKLMEEYASGVLSGSYQIQADPELEVKEEYIPV